MYMCMYICIGVRKSVAYVEVERLGRVGFQCKVHTLFIQLRASEVHGVSCFPALPQNFVSFLELPLLNPKP